MMSNHLASPGSLSSFCKQENNSVFQMSVQSTRVRPPQEVL